MHNAENMDDNALALLGRARAYCASAEQCTPAVRRKLRDWGADAGTAELVVDRLCEEGYVDDVRFARAYCESKMLRSGWGRLKVMHQLAMKGLPREAVNAGMEAVDDEAYMSALEEATRKKAATIRESDPAVRRRKLAVFLAQRGYTMEEVEVMLRKLGVRS